MGGEKTPDTRLRKQIFCASLVDFFLDYIEWYEMEKDDPISSKIKT